MKNAILPARATSHENAKPQLSPYGVTVAQVLRLSELIEFNTDRRVRKKLFEGAQFWGELLCYEPGQAAPSHHHPKEDELLIVIEGHATLSTGNHEFDAPAPSIVVLPATVPHDLRNVGDGRMVAMFVKLSRAFGKVTDP